MDKSPIQNLAIIALCLLVIFAILAALASVANGLFFSAAWPSCRFDYRDGESINNQLAHRLGLYSRSALMASAL